MATSRAAAGIRFCPPGRRSIVWISRLALATSVAIGCGSPAVVPADAASGGNVGSGGGMGTGGRPADAGLASGGAGAPGTGGGIAGTSGGGGAGNVGGEGGGPSGLGGAAGAAGNGGGAGGGSAGASAGTTGGAGGRAGANVAGNAGGGLGGGGRGDGGRGGGGAGGVAGAGGAGGAAGAGGGLTTFVTRQGLQFMEAGRRHVFVGANFWQGMNLGAEAVAGGDSARLRRELDRLQALGVTNVRVVAASEGPDSAPYRLVPSLMPMPGVYNEGVFKGLDLFLDELSRRGIRAVMVLNNYWEWTGGMGQYVSWAQGTAIPDRIAPGGNYNTYIQYVNRFYACSSCQTTYRAHIQTVVNRVNTVNGRRYRDDPTIFSWQLANEPRDYPSNWIGDTAQYIKSLDPNHMVSVGSEGTWGGNFTTTHQSQYIDYTTCHIWVEPWGMYDANNSSAATLQTASNFATGYLRDHDTAAKQLGKPLVLEEFGLARDGWTATGKNDPAAAITHRDGYYRALYAVVEASLAASGGALAGDNFWAWGGEARPPSKWTGDPPHEPPGWFSVYDKDTTTTAIISAHAAALRR